MLSNTISLGSVTLTKIREEGYQSEYLYRGTTVMYTLMIRHQRTKATASQPSKDRHNVELVKTTFGVGGAPDVTDKVYVVIEQLPNVTGVENLVGLMSILSASDYALALSVVGWES